MITIPATSCSIIKTPLKFIILVSLYRRSLGAVKIKNDQQEVRTCVSRRLFQSKFTTRVAASHFGTIATYFHRTPATQVVAASIHKQPITPIALLDLSHFFRYQQLVSGVNNWPQHTIQRIFVFPIQTEDRGSLEQVRMGQRFQPGFMQCR